MTRRLKVRFEEAIYHATLRGAERRAIFTENCERERFLDRVDLGQTYEGCGSIRRAVSRVRIPDR